jgi:hypothetical protein
MYCDLSLDHLHNKVTFLFLDPMCFFHRSFEIQRAKEKNVLFFQELLSVLFVFRGDASQKVRTRPAQMKSETTSGCIYGGPPRFWSVSPLNALRFANMLMTPLARPR